MLRDNFDNCIIASITFEMRERRCGAVILLEWSNIENFSTIFHLFPGTGNLSLEPFYPAIGLFIRLSDRTAIGGLLQPVLDEIRVV